MTKPRADGPARQAVLRAIYDLTEEQREYGSVPIPSVGEMARKAEIDRAIVEDALDFLTDEGFVKVETFGDEDGPNYSITRRGRVQIEATYGSGASGPNDQPLVRDLDVVRALLIYITEHARKNNPAEQPQVEGFSDELVAFHLEIMKQANLIRGDLALSQRWILYGTTWEGQDFLNAAKDDSIWHSVKKNAGGLFSTLTITVAKELLIQEGRRRLGLPPAGG